MLLSASPQEEGMCLITAQKRSSSSKHTSFRITAFLHCVRSNNDRFFRRQLVKNRLNDVTSGTDGGVADEAWHWPNMSPL